ncbi:DsbA family protein [Breoghania sp. L-A4]|uniref:DsbA family protein n=1 Tax=Breoghania sp. L-A4 TaxID=2304600 RepID=UPI000E35AE0E|nr:DsbA family protein [Breoghania sp. L-A4]AXS40284.1 DsbA family protein [Breoghania sp. L-A4]
MKRILRAAAGLAIGAAMTIAAPFAAGTASAEPFDAAKRGEIEQIIRNYLLSNPEVVRDAFIELERRQKEEENAARAGTIASNADILFNSTRQVVLGNPEGDVTLVEFFDYNCGYCKRSLSDMNRLIEEDDQLRVVLKEFPVLGQGSVEAAKVGVALNLTTPELYGAFHNKLLSGRGQANAARAREVALDVGADADALDTAMKDSEVAATIEEVYGLANGLGLTGTPSYVVGNEVVFGAVGYDQLKKRISDFRQCGSTSC